MFFPFRLAINIRRPVFRQRLFYVNAFKLPQITARDEAGAVMAERAQKLFRSPG